MIESARGLLRPTPFAQAWRICAAYRPLKKNLRATDLFLVGHPRSGNTWLSYMLAIALNDDHEARINLANIDKFAPYIGDDRAVARFRNVSDPRLFRNHYPLWPGLYPKTIYIVRDPRAVIVSFYKILRTRGDFDIGVNDFVERYLAGKLRARYPQLIRWDVQVLAWMRRATRQPVLFVTYEDLARDRGAELRKIFGFIGQAPSDESLRLAVERGSFAAMQDMERDFGVGRNAERGLNFVRRGEASSWNEELPAASRRRIEGELGDAMRTLGYEP
jgi:hypothetical protein